MPQKIHRECGDSTKLVVATTTFAERSQATQMAKLVIEQKAAACAQVGGPIESYYRWEGQICQETEWRLTIKSTTLALPRLRDLVLANHPYRQPQWVVLEAIGTTAGYENWVRDSVELEGLEDV